MVAGAEPGPAPDTAAFIQRMEEEKKRQERGEVGNCVYSIGEFLFSFAPCPGSRQPQFPGQVLDVHRARGALHGDQRRRGTRGKLDQAPAHVWQKI